VIFLKQPQCFFGTVGQYLSASAAHCTLVSYSLYAAACNAINRKRSGFLEFLASRERRKQGGDDGRSLHSQRRDCETELVRLYPV
jgi:hypothetical protein